FVAEVNFTREDFPPDKRAWLKYSVWVFNPFFDHSSGIVMWVGNSDGTKEWFNVPLRFKDSAGENWYQFENYLEINPSELSPSDKIKAYIWNPRGAHIWVDELKTEILIER
ncbi:MAG: hypothetical protein AAFV80_17210, partial [Bacteroidota bacterium]